MPTLHWHKLVIFACLLASSAIASNNETGDGCPEGEKQDEQSDPECCVPNLLIEEQEGLICAEQPDDMNVAVALTLILSFTFLISLQCFMNDRDVDMREYAYTVISSTVSIFSAVLAFNSLDGLVQVLISTPLQKATGLGESLHLGISAIHSLFWYVATQFIIALVSNALKSDEWRRDQLIIAARAQEDPEHQEEVTSMLNVEINSVSYGIVCAHLTGFASINFWTQLQQTKTFNGSPLQTLVPIPLAVLSQLILERITDTCRYYHISVDGNKDWFEDMWDDKCQEAEDDIMGLTLSVLIVNSLRYYINDRHGHACLPNSEQKEEGIECKFDHNIFEALVLIGSGWAFVIALFLTKLLFIKIRQRRQAQSEPNSPLTPPFGSIKSSRDLKKSKTCDTKMQELLEHVKQGEWGESTRERSVCEEITERMEDVTLTTLGMAHAWCVFHGTHELLMVINPSFLGHEENATTLSVVCAFGMTYIGFICIRFLNSLAQLDDKWTPEEVDDSIKTVISAVSIFIGFSWEQTFDVSIDQLAERTRIYGGPNIPAMAKVVIGGACIGVVFCAWKWFILPFVFRKGWRYGYIFSKKDLQDRCQELATHDPNFSWANLKGVAKLLATKGHKTRFNVEDDTLPPLNGDGDNPPSISEAAGYNPLPSNEVESLRLESQRLTLFTRVLEQEIAEVKRSKFEAMRKEIQDAISQEWSGQVEALLTEIENLRSHSKSLEQQLEGHEAISEENQELKIHTKFLEHQLVDARRSDVEALQTEIQELKMQISEARKAKHEWKIHRRFLERLLEEERRARKDLERSGNIATQEVKGVELDQEDVKKLATPDDFSLPSRFTSRGTSEASVAVSSSIKTPRVELLEEDSRKRSHAGGAATPLSYVSETIEPSPSPAVSSSESRSPVGAKVDLLNNALLSRALKSTPRVSLDALMSKSMTPPGSLAKQQLANEARAEQRRQLKSEAEALQNAVLERLQERGVDESESPASKDQSVESGSRSPDDRPQPESVSRAISLWEAKVPKDGNVQYEERSRTRNALREKLSLSSSAPPRVKFSSSTSASSSRSTL